MPDLGGALNAVERRVLALLAEGHTAKTAAAALNLSEGAVNERLREARRKTGIGSSRELARRLAAEQALQENKPSETQPPKNRDGEIGVFAPAPSGNGAVTDLPHRAAGRLRKGALAMSLLIGAAIATVIFGGQDAPTETRTDPLLGDLMTAKGNEPRDLYAQVRAEERDAAWAPSAEAALANRFGAVPGIAGLRVTCGSTLCEVAGILLPGDRTGESLLSVQDVALNGVRTIGFGGAASFSVGGKTAGKGSAFAAYPRRTESTPPVIVHSSPADGAVLAAGPITVSVTFDRPMRRDSYSFVTVDGANYPDCIPVPQVSADARTFVLRCTGVAGISYAIGINHGRFRNFVAEADGIPAVDTIIRFSVR